MVGKCPGCGFTPRTGKTRDLNKHMDLTRSRPCQAFLQLTQAQNASHAENATPEQNQLPVPKGDLISFDENPPMHQPIEAREPAVDPGIGFSSKQNSVNYRNKTILIYKNIANGFEFYNRNRKWYGVKEDFRGLSNKYYFIKTDLKETTIEVYKRINEESKAIAEKTNRQVDMRKSGSYTLTSLNLFRKTTLAPKRSEKIDEKENAWLNLASTGALVFAEKYEEEAIQYDFRTIDVSLVEKWNKFPYGIFKATIEGNPPKKSLQCTRYLRYNPYRIYTHFDLECAKRNGLKVYLLDESPNALIYEKNTCISGSDMFGKWGNILYNIKKEGGTAGKGVLCEQRNGQNYGIHPRIKPFLLASARKRISEIVKPLGDQVKRIYTDGFIVAGKVELKTGIEMGELKFEKKGVCVVKNCISVTWKPSYPEIPNLIIFKENELRSTNNLPDFEKIQDKEQLTVKRKLSKKSDMNLTNEIIIEIFQHLQTQNERLCGNNELLFPVLYVNKQWNECATYLIWRRITLYRYNIRNFVELIKKKPLANAIKYIKQIEFERIDNYMNEFQLEDIMTLDTCKNLNHIFIYGSNRIAPKTVLSIPEKSTSIKTIKIQNCERITDKIVNQLVSKYPKIEINKIEVDSRSEDDIAPQIYLTKTSLW
ncbi:11149_t:CDS:2 [Cetraspora pellucida]|uniref:11149_t:CDS:1 n=1 Tax=Cetraspora pellucida TaxID=1433469 RepID=A0ACA9KN32_9GLOM|nr:11149_t:CDS:2 [Cetraspora pellucida]